MNLRTSLRSSRPTSKLDNVIGNSQRTWEQHVEKLPEIDNNKIVNSLNAGERRERQPRSQAKREEPGNEVAGAVVQRLENVIAWIVIFSTVVKMFEK